MIEPKYGTLQTMFADRVFRIPHYQRFYSWHRKQRQDLFEDLRKLASQGGDNHHFMATIVCHRTKEIRAVGGEEYRLYDIVDGQQRLTTLILILKGIQLALNENAEERKDLALLLLKRDGNLILLQTNNANEHIFNAFLREGREPSASEIKTQADVNLRNAIRDCRAFVADWGHDKGELLSLLRLVKNRLGFVLYDTEDSRAVYTLFEVLNSRGLAVDWLDKCKSVLMGKAFELSPSTQAAEAAIVSLQKLWGNIYQELAQVTVSGEEVLRVAATLKYGPMRGKPLQAELALERFRADCKEPDHPRQLTMMILDATKKLILLESNVFLGPVTDVLHARILAVALMSTTCLNDNERRRALDQWERVTFRIFGLAGKDSRNEVGTYVRLANKVNNGAEGASRYSEITSSLRELGQDYSIDDVVAQGLAGKSCYATSPELCRYVLWKYEEHLAAKSGKGGTVDEHVRREIWRMRAGDSVEHIFPQNPEPGGAWDGKMRRGTKKPEPIEKHVHRIGNLLLLPEELNEEARRQGFRQKKEVYQRHNLRMVQEVLRASDWSLDDIEAREARIVKWAKSTWADLAD
ncbi:MAG: DUF262 domain-containing HNH endonuclease family protein [Planctomycetes bacterium]|nr:DUF262 domain-containing HNH endonuclease family protein [Planctomycetota bacterium]